MPVKKLPPVFVSRLKKVVTWANKRETFIPKYLNKMKNIDRRLDWPEVREAALKDSVQNSWGTRHQDIADLPGYRVRQLNVSRHFPKTPTGNAGLEIVIKHTHDLTAEETLRQVRERVRKFNKHPNGLTFLLEPNAYAIGENLIAMAKTDAPTVEEVIVGRLSPAGEAVIQKLAEQHLKGLGKRWRQIEYNYPKPQAIEKAIRAVKRIIKMHGENITRQTKIAPGDLLVLPKGGRMVFIAMPDAIVEEKTNFLLKFT
jgi:hypothetical protein